MTGSERGTGEYEYEVSVVILTYHPDWNKLRQTVLSAVFQMDVHREIVIADDGSKDNCRKQLEELFEELQFPDYRLVMNPGRGIKAEFKENEGWDIRLGKLKLNSWYGTLLILLIVLVVASLLKQIH